MPFCTFTLLKYGQFFLCPKGRVSSRYGLPYKVRNQIRIYPKNRIRILSVWYGIRIFLKFKILIRISAKDSEPHFPSCYRVNFVKRGRIHNIYNVNRSIALTVMRQKMQGSYPNPNFSNISKPDPYWSKGSDPQVHENVVLPLMIKVESSSSSSSGISSAKAGILLLK